MISGATLRELRIRAGRKQAEVATAAGIPASVLSAYERGHRDPGLQAVSRILDALGLEVRFVPRLDPPEQGRILVQVLELAEAFRADLGDDLTKTTGTGRREPGRARKNGEIP